MTKRALISGITGQDGSYLAEHLLDLGYEVHGIVRRVALEDPEHRFARIRHILDRVHLHAASLDSYPSVFSVISQLDVDEFYHLAAQSFVAESLADGFSTMSTNINGTHYVLAALHQLRPTCRFYFAASSEMFGSTLTTPQNERTAFEPRTPYGVSKVAGFHLTSIYRELHGMFCCSGILFNHESPRRGFEFVTRKITRTVARIKLGAASELRLGNLDARRDWGHAKDYVRAIHLMLQTEAPTDYVVATGHARTVREFCECAFNEVELNYADYVVVDPRFYRRSEPSVLVGDAARARRELDWEPEHSFEDLVREMIAEDLAAVARSIATMPTTPPVNV
jgi:GDPmannose 4,6-dehydratase